MVSTPKCDWAVTGTCYTLTGLGEFTTREESYPCVKTHIEPHENHVAIVDGEFWVFPRELAECRRCGSGLPHVYPQPSCIVCTARDIGVG